MSAAAPGTALVQRILAGDAPLQLRQAAARGALPIARVDLSRLFVRLLDDPDAAVREAAQASLAAIPTAALGEILSDPTCDASVLVHFAPIAARDPALAEPVAFHPAAPDAAIEALAAQGSAPVVDLVLTNQERILASPGLLDRLTTNPALRPDQRGKILDILERIARETLAAGGQDAAADAGPAAVAPETVTRILEVDVGDLFAASEIMGGEEFERSPDLVVRSAYKRILKMGPAQKAVLAMKGGREERMILVRDTNKIVALSVLKNPRMNAQDAEEIARLRNVTEEVLRGVSLNREWSKRYGVAEKLVRNPRTPQGISLTLVQRLTAHDLKDLLRDRNVPELVRRQAKRIHDLRNQKSTPSHGRK
jgi:hypothetical protein